MSTTSWLVGAALLRGGVAGELAWMEGAALLRGGVAGELFAWVGGDVVDDGALETEADEEEGDEDEDGGPRGIVEGALGAGEASES